LEIRKNGAALPLPGRGFGLNALCVGDQDLIASFKSHASVDLPGIQLSCGKYSASAASSHAFSHSLGHEPSLNLDDCEGSTAGG